MPLLSTTKRGVIYHGLLKTPQENLVQTEANKALLEVGIGDPANLTTPKQKKLLRDNIKKRSLSVDTLTNQKLVKQYEAIINGGLTVKEGTALIQKNVFKELSTSRVEQIVRTETIRA